LFDNFVSKFEGWKGRHFYGRPPAALSLSTSLSKIQQLNQHQHMIFIVISKQIKSLSTFYN